MAKGLDSAEKKPAEKKLAEKKPAEKKPAEKNQGTKRKADSISNQDATPAKKKAAVETPKKEPETPKKKPVPAKKPAQGRQLYLIYLRFFIFLSQFLKTSSG